MTIELITNRANKKVGFLALGRRYILQRYLNDAKYEHKGYKYTVLLKDRNELITKWAKLSSLISKVRAKSQLLLK